MNNISKVLLGMNVINIFEQTQLDADLITHFMYVCIPGETFIFDDAK